MTHIEFIEIFLLLILIERVSIHRRRYKIAIDNNGGYPSGYWSIWIYCKLPDEDRYWRSGGRRLIHFDKYIIPKIV